MKIKILNISLILVSLFGYLEWGGGNHVFLFAAEWEIVVKLFSSPESVLHPFVIVPMLGQLLLLITLVQKEPSRILSILGLLCIAVLFVLMFLIGLLSLHFKIIISTIPFMVLGIITAITLVKQKKG